MAVLVVWGRPSTSRGEFVILDQTAKPDTIARETTFQLTFNHTPDFFHADAFDRPRDSFQYFYDNQPGRFDFEGKDVAIIRGPEIRFHDDIPIRDSLNPSGEDFPHAEGWGRERGAVDLQLDGAVLTFTVPWKLLNETDGKFSYRVAAFEFGAQTSEIATNVIRLPSPLWLGGSMLAILPLVRAVRRGVEGTSHRLASARARLTLPLRSVDLLARRCRLRGQNRAGSLRSP
jgi:hypothetical protein